MNTPGQSDKVVVRGANHDAEVAGLVLAMKPFEMLAIVSQKHARFLLRMGEDLVVRPTLVGPTTLKKTVTASCPKRRNS